MGEESKEAFQRERKTMGTILITFDLACGLRAAYDSAYVQANPDGMAGNISNILATSVFDLLPISCILYYHMKNFKTIVRTTADDK